MKPAKVHMLHRTFLLLLPVALGSASCFQMQMTAQAGYTSMALDGDIALSNTSGGVTSSINQDIPTALGLGSERGSPYARVQLDMGVPVLTLSGFTFEEDGQGTLQAQFGNIAANTQVDTHLEFANLKASYAFEIDVGPVSVAPGIAVDLFDLQMQVSDSLGVVTENVDVLAPVPMAFVRAEGDLGIVGAVAELGLIKVPKIQDVEGTFWDAELAVEVRPLPMLHLFAGYRQIHIDVDGISDNQSFAADLDISGWMIGGGIRF